MSAKPAFPFARADSIVYRITDSPRCMHAIDYVINLPQGPELSCIIAAFMLSTYDQNRTELSTVKSRDIARSMAR